MSGDLKLRALNRAYGFESHPRLQFAAKVWAVGGSLGALRLPRIPPAGSRYDHARKNGSSSNPTLRSKFLRASPRPVFQEFEPVEQWFELRLLYRENDVGRSLS
jgi:hypothetical protein